MAKIEYITQVEQRATQLHKKMREINREVSLATKEMLEVSEECRKLGIASRGLHCAIYSLEGIRLGSLNTIEWLMKTNNNPEKTEWTPAQRMIHEMHCKMVEGELYRNLIGKRDQLGIAKDVKITKRQDIAKCGDDCGIIIKTRVNGVDVTLLFTFPAEFIPERKLCCYIARQKGVPLPSLPAYPDLYEGDFPNHYPGYIHGYMPFSTMVNGTQTAIEFVMDVLRNTESLLVS